MKAYGRMEVDLHSFWISAQDGGVYLHVPAVTSPGNVPQYPSAKRLGGANSQYGRLGEQNDPLHLPGFAPRTVLPVAQSLNSTDLKFYIMPPAPNLNQTAFLILCVFVCVCVCVQPAPFPVLFLTYLLRGAESFLRS